MKGQWLEPSQPDEVVTTIAVADGSLTQEALTAWLERNSRPRTD